MKIGIVAATPHQNGRVKSAIRPKVMTSSQNSRRCMGPFYAFRNQELFLFLSRMYKKMQ